MAGLGPGARARIVETKSADQQQGAFDVAPAPRPARFPRSFMIGSPLGTFTVRRLSSRGAIRSSTSRPCMMPGRAGILVYVVLRIAVQIFPTVCFPAATSPSTGMYLLVCLTLLCCSHVSSRFPLVPR